MRKLRKFIVKNAFREYLPERTDFEIVEELIPDLKTREFLVEAKYISVDPYMRSFARHYKVPYQQFGFQVGKIIESKNSEYPIGMYVVSHSGWRDYAVLNDHPDSMFNMRPYIPERGVLSESLGVGALGIPGVTAYLGLLEICKPKKGDVVCVTSAAGAVGSLVGQIAKIKGCTVIGFAGTDEKVNMLESELGFHFALNYNNLTNVHEALREISDGVDCFFDNVGGQLAAGIMECMNENGRVAVCGSISTYGDDSKRHTRAQTRVTVKVESFSFTQWEWPRQNEALQQLKEWLKNGTIKAKETVTNGFEELPDTLIRMLKGQNVGKALVKV